MSPALFTTTVVVANVNGVPTQPVASYRDDYARIADERPTVVASCEAWSVRARSEARRALANPPWLHHQPTKPNGAKGTSAMIAWRGDVWREQERGVLELHGSVRNVCDVRELAWVRLKHRETGRVVLFGSTHPAPTATKKGRREINDARAARELANERLHDFLHHRTHPVLMLADWNQPAGFLGAQMHGQKVRYAMEGIIGAMAVDGRFARVGLARARNFALPKSDHPGFRVRFSLTAS